MTPPLPTRLNFQITKKAQERLEDYCEQSGRSASDVVRQLVKEYLDDIRLLRGSQPIALNGRRTNCTLPAPLVRRLDSKTSGILRTKGSIISRLLEDFLVLGQRHDGAVVLRTLRNLVQACEERDRGGDVSLYHETLARARQLLKRGEKDG